LREDTFFPGFDIFTNRHVTDGRAGCQVKAHTYTRYNL
jgi:hypothetical protein